MCFYFGKTDDFPIQTAEFLHPKLLWLTGDHDESAIGSEETVDLRQGGRERGWKSGREQAVQASFVHDHLEALPL